jgi:tetratricopeptide (TPR) repeat protein
LACALPAKANDFDEFEAARNAYDMQDYAKAAQLFDTLVGGDVPRLTNRSLLLESEKYLAASYLFLGKLDLAEQRFDLLLHMDPGYMLDPLGFPEEVQRLFARVKTRLDAERLAAAEARQREEDRASKAQVDRERHERERWQRLTQLAQTEHVSEVRSRWVATVPLGVGQFQNGHDGLGLVLAVSETSLLAICITSFVLHENLRGQKPAPSRVDAARLAEEAFRYTNQISFGLFAALAVTGIIDAQIRFRGSRSYERRRPLPASLYGGPELSIGPTSLALRLRF